LGKDWVAKIPDGWNRGLRCSVEASSLLTLDLCGGKEEKVWQSGECWGCEQQSVAAGVGMISTKQLLCSSKWRRAEGRGHVDK
jgi:hypothetical protein